MQMDKNKKNIPFAKVVCDGNEMKYVQEVIESGWLTTASKAKEFETRFAAMVEAKHAIAVNSCTAALHLAMDAIGVKAGDRVFVPTMTFTATAEVVRYLGADPVFLDVEFGSSLLTPYILQAAIGKYPDVRTLIIVHYGGQAAKMNVPDGQGILDICRKHDIKVVEDAAHAFPARLNGKIVGSFGTIACFSFYANKTITTGEGGMLVTNDDEIARRARVMRLHGIDRDIWSRFRDRMPNWEYDVIAPGFKYNMPDINAAIGLAQLERAEALRQERERCARFYFKALAGLENVELPKLHVKLEEHAWHLFPIILRANASVSRQRFIELLADEGIGTSVHYKPLHRMTYYNNVYNLNSRDFPNAERIWKGCISLPIYPSLSDEELKYICHTIIEIVYKTKK
jgi:dTDP-4-amino-4,6-dideoxygalactose transaminase